MTVCSEKRRLPACLPPRFEISRRKLPDGLLLRDVRAARGETSSDIIARLLTRSMQRRELESDRVSGNERSDRFIYRTRRIVALHRGAENGSNGRDGRAERGAWIISSRRVSVFLAGSDRSGSAFPVVRRGGEKLLGSATVEKWSRGQGLGQLNSRETPYPKRFAH